MQAAASSPAPGYIYAVVQRCQKARLLTDAAADVWTEIGRGLIVHVSFADGAQEGDSDRRLRLAAKSLLTANLSTSAQWTADHSDAESVVSLCRKGEPQGLMVVPQASLVAKLEAGDKTLKYYKQCSKDDASSLYHSFVDILGKMSRELIVGSTSSKTDLASFEDMRAKRAAASLISPDQFFKTGEYEGLYTQYDERGVPTHDREGTECAKSHLKKLEKIFVGQSKKYAKAEEAGKTGSGATEDTSSKECATKDEVQAEEKEAEGYMKTNGAVVEAPEEVPIPEGMCLPDIKHGTFGGRQGFEMISSGPFTHSLIF